MSTSMYIICILYIIIVRCDPDAQQSPAWRFRISVPRGLIVGGRVYTEVHIITDDCICNNNNIVDTNTNL